MADSTSVGARYPLHELEALLRWPLVDELAEMCGVTEAAVKGWKIRGLSHDQADRLACRFGYHPALVWTDWIACVQHPRGTPHQAVRPRRVTPAYGEGSPGERVERALRRQRVGAPA